ncbi:MAG: type II toxin-antitoxin system VapB family antitoxin [Nitrospiraceae bacterium]|nr:type II toxin-antitoxin system VapB family antitoxin [Nitrospiraceae bacterium]
MTGHHKGNIVVLMAGTTKRLSIALDHALLAEARRLTRSRTKRETIAKALEELVKLEHRKALAHAVGTGLFETTEAEFRSRRRRMHAHR